MAYLNSKELVSIDPYLSTKLLPMQHGERALKAGEVLLQEGSPIAAVFVVVTGALKLKRRYKSGLFLEKILGAWEAYGFQEHRSGQLAQVLLVAATDTVVRMISPADIDTWCKSEDIAMAMSAKSSLKRPFDLLPVRARVAATVWSLGKRFGSRASGTTALSVDLDLTREELGQLAGTVYESVIRNLTQLKVEGVIAMNGRQIQILAEDQLARIGQLVVESKTYD